MNAPSPPAQAEASELTARQKRYAARLYIAALAIQDDGTIGVHIGPEARKWGLRQLTRLGVDFCPLSVDEILIVARRTAP